MAIRGRSEAEGRNQGTLLKALHINGNDLTLEAVREVARMADRRPVLLAPDAREAVTSARAVVDAVVANNQLAYAITPPGGQAREGRLAGGHSAALPDN